MIYLAGAGAGLSDAQEGGAMKSMSDTCARPPFASVSLCRCLLESSRLCDLTLILVISNPPMALHLPMENDADSDFPPLPPIIFAAGRGHLEMVRLLLEARADKNTRDPDDGRTALMAAAARGHLRVVNFLLQVGADKEAATPDGDTALTYAAESGHLNVVYMLLEAGADIDAAADGHTPLILAACGHLEIARLLRSV